MNYNQYGICDFETTKEEHTKVWLAGCKSLADDTRNSFKYFNNIDTFMIYVMSEYTRVYFHNLKFDGSFILNYLNKQGYKFFDSNLKNLKTGRPNKQPKKTYTTMISDTGQWYNIKIKDKQGNTLTIIDSLKLLPFSVRQMGESIGYDKLTINDNNDYTDYRITDQAIEYLYHDLEIPRRFIIELFNLGLTKSTCASNAMHSFKKLIGKDNYTTWFPDGVTRKDYKEIMYNYTIQSYFGGECFTKNNEPQTTDAGIVIDNNSEYPSRCYGDSECLMPYGYPIDDNLNDIKNPLQYIQFGSWEHIENTISFMTLHIKSLHLKSGYTPNIRRHELYDTINTNNNVSSQLGYTNFDMYDESAMWISHGSNMLIRLNEIDYNYMLQAYEVDYIIIDYMRFRAQKGMFQEYYSFWSEKKIEYTKSDDKVKRQIAKNMMNSLTGKFGMNIKQNYKIPYYQDDTLQLTTNVDVYGFDNYRDSIYPPIISVITAEGRRCLNDCITKIGIDKFLYTDTDSVHFTLPSNINYNKLIDNDTGERTKLLQFFKDKNIDIDKSKLGAWDIEGVFKRGKYIRCKTYLEELTYDFNKKEKIDKTDVKACGMTDSIHKYCTYDNFDLNTCYTPERLASIYRQKGFNCVIVADQDAKLLPRQVAGGVVLKEYGFSINRIY